MKIVALFLVLICCSHTMYSQSYLIQKVHLRNNKSYFVKDTFYDFEELDYLFNKDEELTRLYNARLNNHKVGKIFGYTTIGLWASGVISFVSDNSHTEGFLNAGEAFGVILIVLVSPITGTIGLIAHHNGKFLETRTIDSYNKLHNDKYGRRIEYPRLGIAKSGIGLTISF